MLTPGAGSDRILRCGLSSECRASTGRYQYAVGFRHTNLNYDVPAPRVVFLPEGTGQTFDASDHYTSLTLAGALRRGGLRWSLGASFKRAQMDFAAIDISGWVFDVGSRMDWRLMDDDGGVVNFHLGLSLLGLENGFETEDYVLGIPT